MATILLQAAGAALGGMFGLAGKAIGMAAGSLAGYLVERALINSTRTIEGARLSSAQAITAEEGAAIPRLYGTMRLGGVIIWATRFEERRQVSRQGFKGGPRVVEYDYFGNVAIGLCEGEIAGVRRVWADGRELDLTTVEMRVHAGASDQAPDPLIEAKQSVGGAPAYRGLAYVVFEGLPLEPYGNRIPQMQFEVMRPVAPLNRQIRAVTLIPGATEYGLHPELVTATPSEGETKALNRHVLTAPSDFAASIDELQALCPNIESVALVVSWFADDLRAGQCAIRPGVTDTAAAAQSLSWSVCGVGRDAARQVSRVEGRAAYGGTPTDASVIAAIIDLKARGLKVTLYPLAMMDIPAGNGLPDPYGGVEQAAYPWRGRITGAVAPGRVGATDKTAQARNEISAFAGGAAPAHFAVSAGGVTYSGPGSDFGYRRMALHCAALAVAAGGVDAFVIGSELRGLTTLRDETGAYPFVAALQLLAADARAMLGAGTKITYGADWSEYFGHHDGGDARFHLDELWAHPAIDAVGVDNYMPLADWRDADWKGGNPDGATGPADRAAMTAAIGGGEGFDWWYASPPDRAARVRTPITDGAYGKPWVFRPKDLIGWWSNPHHDRVAGVELAQPTDWVPRSKPVWFTELGCPAVDKGANQPNVFPDPKSAENARPHFSNGGRDDAHQQRFLAAHMARWDEDDSAHEDQWNPMSPIYGGKMVPHERIYVWTWDARPFPAFPSMGAEWGDNANHATGHWLNGRLCGAPLDGLIQAILADHGLPPADATAADGHLAGYVVERPASARDALEPLLDLFGLVASDTDGLLTIRAERGAPATLLAKDDLVGDAERPVIRFDRLPDSDLPGETVLGFRDPLRDHQTATVRAVEPEGRGREVEAIGLPATLDPATAEALSADRLRRIWTGRSRIAIAMPAASRRPAVGEAIRISDAALPGDWLVLEAEEGIERRLTLRAIDRAPPHAASAPVGVALAPAPAIAGPPLAEFLDLPLADADSPAESRLMVAAWAKPWRPQAVLASPGADGFDARARLDAPARVGVLRTALTAMPAACGGRVLDMGIEVRLSDGALASVSRAALLNGANLAAVRAANGEWELLQFETAEEIATGVFRLTGLLRGQGGTTDAMASGAVPGARFVAIDSAVKSAGLRAVECGLTLNWRVGPVGTDISGLATVTGGVRARLLLAPVHLRASRLLDGAISFTWIRCGRMGADGWDADEIPLDASVERYFVTIRNAGGAMLESAESASPQWLWPAAAVAAAFPAMPPDLVLDVRQTSPELGQGLTASRRFQF